MNEAVKLGRRKRWRWFRLPDIGQPYLVGIRGAYLGKIFMDTLTVRTCRYLPYMKYCKGGELLKVNRNRKLFATVGYRYGGQ